MPAPGAEEIIGDSTHPVAPSQDPEILRGHAPICSDACVMEIAALTSPTRTRLPGSYTSAASAYASSPASYPVTYTPTGEGKFFFTMMAAFAELERDIIHERTMAGLAAARSQGRTGGRPTVMDIDKLAAARACHANGESPTRIAKALGVSRASVYRHLAATDAQITSR